MKFLAISVLALSFQFCSSIHRKQLDLPQVSESQKLKKRIKVIYFPVISDTALRDTVWDSIKGPIVSKEELHQIGYDDIEKYDWDKIIFRALMQSRRGCADCYKPRMRFVVPYGRALQETLNAYGLSANLFSQIHISSRKASQKSDEIFVEKKYWHIRIGTSLSALNEILNQHCLEIGTEIRQKLEPLL